MQSNSSSTNDDTKQVTLDKVCPDWILDYKNTQRRDKTLEGLKSNDLRKLGFSCKNTGNTIISTLPTLKLTPEDKDKPKKKHNIGNIQTTALIEEEDEKDEDLDLEGEEIITE